MVLFSGDEGGRNAYGAVARGGLITVVTLSLFASAVAAQTVGRTENTQGKKYQAQQQIYERHTGVVLLCQKTNSSEGDAYNCSQDNTPHDLFWHLGRLAFRGLRDPIAILTSLLFTIGGIQVRISHLTARRQLRAYVFATHFDMADGTYLTGSVNGLGQPRAIVRIQNSGTTPAYKVWHGGNISIKRLSEEGTLEPPVRNKGNSVSTIAPGVSTSNFSMFHRVPTAAEISEIQTQVSAVYVWGRIEYEDVFKRKHFATYRMKYSGIWPPPYGTTMNFCEDGNDNTGNVRYYGANATSPRFGFE